MKYAVRGGLGWLQALSSPTAWRCGWEFLVNRSGPVSMAASQVCAFVDSGGSGVADLQFHFQPMSTTGTPAVYLDDFDAFTASVCILRPACRSILLKFRPLQKLYRFALDWFGVWIHLFQSKKFHDWPSLSPSHPSLVCGGQRVEDLCSCRQINRHLSLQGVLGDVWRRGGFLVFEMTVVASRYRGCESLYDFERLFDFRFAQSVTSSHCTSTSGSMV